MQRVAFFSSPPGSDQMNPGATDWARSRDPRPHKPIPAPVATQSMRELLFTSMRFGDLRGRVPYTISPFLTWWSPKRRGATMKSLVVSGFMTAIVAAPLPLFAQVCARNDRADLSSVAGEALSDIEASAAVQGD